MLNDFEMIVKQFPRKNITIYPIADVHFGALSHKQKEWESFLQKVKSRPDIYLVIGGDMLDNVTKTSVGVPWDNPIRPAEAKKIMAQMLDPIKDRILCMVSGNHCARNKDVDDDPLYDIACKLDIEDVYRPNMAFLKLQFGDKDGNGLLNPTYTVVVAHGAGSSIYVGGAGAKGERFGMSVDGMDLLVTGHTHKPADLPNAKIYIDRRNNKVSVKLWRYVVCSSWLGYAPYAAKSLMTPTAFTEQQIILHGKEKAIEVSQLTR